VSSVDVLFHLRKEEFSKRGEEVDSIPPSSPDDVGTDSMTNTCRHLLQQRRYVYLRRLYYSLNSNLTQLLSYIPGTLGRITRRESECHSLGWPQVKR
jgi:hypothetical protein